MRHGRAKASRRTLQFYRLNAPHLKPPYKLLLDGTFLVASIRNKLPLYERFEKILQHEAFTCYVTRSTLAELEVLAERAASIGKESDDDSNINFFAQARQNGLDECEIIENDKVPASTTATDDKRNKRALRDFSDASRDIFVSIGPCGTTP